MPEILNNLRLPNVTSLPVSAKTGDMVYLTTDNNSYKWNGSVWQIVGAGTVNTFTIPTVRVYNNAAISLATSGTWQTLTFNSERFNTDSMHSTSTNTSRITFNTPGYYYVHGNLAFAANATGERGLRIILNGTTIIAEAEASANSGAGVFTQSVVSTVYQFSVGDFVELQAVQASTAALNVLAASANNVEPNFGAVWQSAGANTINEVGVPATFASASANQTVTAGAAWTTLTPLATEGYDTDSMHDTVTNSGRITIKTPGLYQVSAYAGATTGQVTGGGNRTILSVLKNGATEVGRSTSGGVGAAEWSMSTPILLAAGDFLEARFWNDSGGSLIIYTEFKATWQGSSKTVIPTARVYKSTTTTVGAGGTVSISHDTVRFDNDSMWSAGSPTRLTCKTAGTYIIGGSLGWDGATTTASRTQVGILVNGTAAAINNNNNTADGFAVTSATCVVNLAVGDFVELQAFSVNAHNLVAGSASALYAQELWVAKIGMSGFGTNNDPGWALSGNNLTNTNAGDLVVHTNKFTATAAYIKGGWQVGIAETFPRWGNSADTGALTSGTLRVTGGMVIPAGVPISSITVVAGATGATTPTNQWFCLIDQNLNVLAKTVDDTTTAWAANGTKTLAITGTYTPPTTMAVYVGVLVAATTPPTLSGARMVSGLAGLTPKFSGNSTAALTTPASLGATAAAVTALASASFWAAVQ